MVNYLFRTLTFIVLSLFCSALAAATLEATVDRKELIVDEHLTLTLALINSDTRLRAQGENPNIDLTLLTDQFELGIPQANNNYNLFRNRGRSSSEIIVTLFPKSTGKLTIPAFTVDGESSAPISITVHKAPADPSPELFTQSGVMKKRLWLREQTIAYLDLYHRVELKSAKLGGAIDSKPKMQIQLSKLPQTHRTELYNGVKYNVMRSAWAVAPAIDQTIELYLPDVWVETANGRQQRFPFNDIVIESRPLPTDTPVGTLVGRPTLIQSLSEEEAKQHHTIQLEITLEAPTNIGNLIPKAPALSFPEGLKVYSESDLRKLVDDKEDGSTSVTYRYFIMPLEAGKFQLPEFRLPYFDPVRGTMDEVVMRGLQLDVTPAPIPVTENTAPTEEPAAPVTPAETNSTALPWQITSAILTLLWLGTLFLLRPKKKAPPSGNNTNQPPPLPDRSHHPLHQQLLNAFGSRTLEQGLVRWEAQHGIDEEVRSITRQIQQYCYGRNGHQKIDTLQEAVTQLIDRITNTPVSPSKNKDLWSPKTFAASKES